MKLSDQIRRAVDGSGMTRYRIGKLAGIDKAVMSRFMSHQQGLSLGTLDSLADVLDLRIVSGKQARKGTG